MNNLVKVARITGGIAIGVLIGFDAACLSSGAIECRLMRSVQWESIVAGALGLAGGLFVIYSTRQQIADNERTTAQAMAQAQRHHDEIKHAPLYLAREMANEFHSWANDCLEGANRHSERYHLGEIGWHDFNATLDRWSNGVQSRCSYAATIRNAHSTTYFNYEVGRAITSLAKCADIQEAAEDAGPAAALPARFFITHNKLLESRVRAAYVRTAIDRQLSDT